MASSDAWANFELDRGRVRTLTVDRLKALIQGLNAECGTYINKTGKKQELIDRILGNFDNFRTHNQEDRWMKAKQALGRARGEYSLAPAYSPAALRPPPTPKYAHVPQPTPNLDYHPRLPGTPSAPVAGRHNAKPELRFKESPFFRVDQAVSSVAECPESSSSTDRRQSSVAFTLTPEQIGKLTSSSKYQLRLFCTSSTFYSPSPSFRPSLGLSLVEFPPTCEVRVNGAQLTASVKGLKKKPGTAPPPDLGKLVRPNNSTNRIEMVYVNSQQQPIVAKKYYLVVQLVETTTIEALVAALTSRASRSSQTILKEIQASADDDDDDIVAGPLRMSLKCPLSYMRINLPCRSSKCVHRQCFDATSWYAVNEQTTTWLCPVCEHPLEDQDLIIDGYFSEILQNTNDEVNDVMIEANGEWHTQDNMFGSASWKASHPPTVAPPPKAPTPTRAMSKGKEKASDQEIVVLDSDEDEDENQVKRELSTLSGGRAQSSASMPQDNSVIDLTLDSDDDEPTPPARTARTLTTSKRTADAAGLEEGSPDASGSGWKRGRLEDALTGSTARVTAPLPGGGALQYPRYDGGSW